MRVRQILRWVLIAALLYGGIILMLALMQTALLFPRAMVGPAPALQAGTEVLTLTRADGVTLHGQRIPGQDRTAPLLLGFGGNASNAAGVALMLHQLAPAHDVVTFHYRGYAPSEGQPSAAALLADAEAILDQIAPTAPGGVIAVGFSIGSGVAAHLAQARSLEAALLVTPFDRLAQVAQDSFPVLPVRRLFAHDMDAQAALSGADLPVAIMIATRDEVIPPARAEALAASLPDARVTRIPAGHNDIYAHPDFVPGFRAALSGLLP